MALSSPWFRWSSRFRQAEQNNPPMRSGEQCQAVRVIQQAMIQLGVHPMTRSIRKYGSPDGVFGSETKQAVSKYQKDHTNPTLSSDGVVGQNTMRALDQDLPGGGPKLPPLPARSRYVVPGIIAARNQLARNQTNLCWAYSFAMLAQWRRQQSLEVRDLIAAVGPQWLARYDANRGLPWVQGQQFYKAAGLSTEPLQSFPVSRWSELLRAHGPLLLDTLNNSLGGGHVRVLYGVQGDGSPRGTTMLILDPWRGADYGESYEKFIAKYEGVASQPVLRTALIAHY
ncbi:MAG: peptidoglycan-binding protein [Planctomycetaceae bacterium]|nr:peptidoglycan-binding protein [Planctomycetaceae bacterium]